MLTTVIDIIGSLNDNISRMKAFRGGFPYFRGIIFSGITHTYSERVYFEYVDETRDTDGAALAIVSFSSNI